MLGLSITLTNYPRSRVVLAPGQPALLLWTLNKEGKAEREIPNITGPSDFLPPGSPPCCVDWSKDYPAGELTAFPH